MYGRDESRTWISEAAREAWERLAQLSGDDHDPSSNPQGFADWVEEQDEVLDLLGVPATVHNRTRLARFAAHGGSVETYVQDLDHHLPAGELVDEGRFRAALVAHAVSRGVHEAAAIVHDASALLGVPQHLHNHQVIAAWLGGHISFECMREDVQRDPEVLEFIGRLLDAANVVARETPGSPTRLAALGRIAAAPEDGDISHDASILVSGMELGVDADAWPVLARYVAARLAVRDVCTFEPPESGGGAAPFRAQVLVDHVLDRLVLVWRRGDTAGTAGVLDEIASQDPSQWPESLRDRVASRVSAWAGSAVPAGSRLVAEAPFAWDRDGRVDSSRLRAEHEDEAPETQAITLAPEEDRSARAATPSLARATSPETDLESGAGALWERVVAVPRAEVYLRVVDDAEGPAVVLGVAPRDEAGSAAVWTSLRDLSEEAGVALHGAPGKRPEHRAPLETIEPDATWTTAQDRLAVAVDKAVTRHALAIEAQVDAWLLSIPPEVRERLERLRVMDVVLASGPRWGMSHTLQFESPATFKTALAHLARWREILDVAHVRFDDGQTSLWIGKAGVVDAESA